MADFPRDGGSSGGGRMSGSGDRLREAFEGCFGGVAPIGPGAARGLEVEPDAAGNLWAWWRGPGADGQAVAVGSHLDTVRGGGAYDGALGVVSGLLAVDGLRERGVEPRRPVAVVAFADEEGGRFGVPLFGSRVLTGALDPADLLGRVDEHGASV